MRRRARVGNERSKAILFDGGAPRASLGAGDAAPASPAAAKPIALDDRLRLVEANLIAWALTATAGNKSRAAALLGIKRSTLGDRIARCAADGHPVRGAEA